MRPCLLLKRDLLYDKRDVLHGNTETCHMQRVACERVGRMMPPPPSLVCQYIHLHFKIDEGRHAGLSSVYRFSLSYCQPCAVASRTLARRRCRGDKGVEALLKLY